MIESVLITGGCGFIGSHFTALALQRGLRVLVVDNLSNSSADVICKSAAIGYGEPLFKLIDVRNYDALLAAMKEFNPQGIVHFAGLKAVKESVLQPLEYWSNNLEGTLRVLECARVCGIQNIVFSSTANVYGASDGTPVSEKSPTAPDTPYGQSKLAAETLLQGYAAAHQGVRAVGLRYFNPVGAHPSYLIGETPHGVPANLFPYIFKVVRGEFPHVKVFGTDYPTKDGTGVRDYIHVMDLVEGHFAALERATQGYSLFNLGTGIGYSVKEVLREIEMQTGKELSKKELPRRTGDCAVVVADASKAFNVLGWKPSKTLRDMCADTFAHALKTI